MELLRVYKSLNTFCRPMEEHVWVLDALFVESEFGLRRGNQNEVMASSAVQQRSTGNFMAELWR